MKPNCYRNSDTTKRMTCIIMKLYLNVVLTSFAFFFGEWLSPGMYDIYVCILGQKVKTYVHKEMLKIHSIYNKIGEMLEG